MKFLALSLCASIGLSAAASPAPFPSPAPADPPAPGPFHHAPAPEDSYSSGGWFPSPSPKSSDIPEACLTAFESACSGLTAKQCSQCVIENGMTLTAASCDTIQLIQKECPERRNLRRGLVELAALPSPFPAPAPEDPPAPAADRVAPAPRFDSYGSFQWAPAPMTGSSMSAEEAACANLKLGSSCSFLNDGEAIGGTCVLGSDDATLVCGNNCDDVFGQYCGTLSGKACSNCVMSHETEIEAAGCEIMKAVAACF